MRARNPILTLAPVVALAFAVASCQREDKPVPAVAPKVAPAKPADMAAVQASRIVPVMWPKGAARSDTVSDPLNDELVIVYVEDTGKDMRFLMPQDLERAGVKREELRALAVANLKKVMPSPNLHKGDQYSMITAGNNYESSLLLTPQILAESKVEGDVVVAVPARNLLFITGTKTPGGIEKLRELAARAMRESPHRLTETLFVLRNGEFVKL
jgi:uncharacterized protein YtpQ (UPF0354 family)